MQRSVLKRIQYFVFSMAIDLNKTECQTKTSIWKSMSTWMHSKERFQSPLPALNVIAYSRDIFAFKFFLTLYKCKQVFFGMINACHIICKTQSFFKKNFFQRSFFMFACILTAQQCNIAQCIRYIFLIFKV